MVLTRREELKNDPAQVAAAQALTLDSSRPFGLKGTFGLFGSGEWWQNIERGIAPVTHMHGVISKVYAEGMHNEGRGFEIVTNDGTSHKYSCVTNQRKDQKKYVVGKKIHVSYVKEPLKNPMPSPNGTTNIYSEIVLEISVEG